MTKAEMRQLHSDKCRLEKVKFQSGRGEETRYVVSFSLCPGELIALVNALNDSIYNAVRNDIAVFLRNAGVRAGIIIE